MANPNATVSAVIRLDPPLEHAAAALRAGREVAVEIEGAHRLHLDPADPRSPAFAQVLDALRKQGSPVYLEADPVSSSITRVLIPYVARVVAVHAGKEGLDVELEPSQARHVLRRDAAGFDEMAKRLREALGSGSAVVLTEDDAHRVIDVRAPGPPG